MRFKRQTNHLEHTGRKVSVSGCHVERRKRNYLQDICVSMDVASEL